MARERISFGEADESLGVGQLHESSLPQADLSEASPQALNNEKFKISLHEQLAAHCKNFVYCFRYPCFIPQGKQFSRLSCSGHQIDWLIPLAETGRMEQPLVLKGGRTADGYPYYITTFRYVKGKSDIQKLSLDTPLIDTFFFLY